MAMVKTPPSLFLSHFYSMILIFVNIAGFNMSNIKLSKHNNDMSQTTFYSSKNSIGFRHQRNLSLSY